MEEYDAIIVGGSFAGLATAYFTEAENLLILEREEEVGARQRSTCGAPLEWVKRLGAEKSILRRLDTITLHSPGGREIAIDLPMPYCTIDYRTFCTSVSEHLRNAEIKTGSEVTGVEAGDLKKVQCGRDAYSSRLIVDASGWRAAVASRLRQGYASMTHKVAGLETVAEYDADSIHIYFGSRLIPGGYAWVFPLADGMSRIGVGSLKKVNLVDLNRRFLDFLGLRRWHSGHHGGIIPCLGMRDPVVKDIFVVGDAAGQVLPGTAEGIRKAFIYAEMLGGLISKVQRGELEHTKALEIYRHEVLKSKKFYDTLLSIQKIAYNAPDWAFNRVIEKVDSGGDIAQRLLKAYFEEDLNYAGRLSAPLGFMLTR
ncbi:NAD(P)/FAD-dependent oxidoreductase [Candidatus Pyrohabitans sp.]